MDLYRTILDVIDMRSFSNLWYWIALAVLWSSASHWVLGVPYDLIQRGRAQGGQMDADVAAMVGVNTRRLLGVARDAAVPMFFGVAMMLTVLTLLAFVYWVEFAQAVFFLLAPMVLVGWMSLMAAVRIEAGEDSGEALYRRLMTHRRLVQVVGMFSIFITALFGMWRNMHVAVLN